MICDGVCVAVQESKTAQSHGYAMDFPGGLKGAYMTWTCVCHADVLGFPLRPRWMLQRRPTLPEIAGRDVP